MASLLIGVEATDPTILAGTEAVLITAALLASYLPTRRALRIDPTVVLQVE